ncbi:MAG: HAD family hydrolase [Clostridia bacterium]|nr:HAD family hydrolase [Clostridia bacterium]
MKPDQVIKWIFFDVGSTLVDETEAYDHRVQDIIAGTDITFQEFDDMRIALARQGLDGNSTAINHFGLTKTPWHPEDEVPYPDAKSTLAALIQMGYKLGIIANQKLGTAERLENWGLRQYFDVIAASAEIGYAKPDKRIFEKALEMAGCTARESVMVGDRLDNDMIPAKALGMRTVWIKNGLAQYQSEELGKDIADVQIASLSELLSYM